VTATSSSAEHEEHSRASEDRRHHVQRIEAKASGSPPVAGTRCAEQHLGLPSQPGSDRRRLPWKQQQQYVGIDLHRRRSVIVRRTESGETLDKVRIDNDPVFLAAELAKAGEHPEVILEATYGCTGAADVIQECGGNVHLAHPLGNTGATAG